MAQSKKTPAKSAGKGKSAAKSTSRGKSASSGNAARENAKQKEENKRLKSQIKTLKQSRDIENTFSYNFMPYILCFIGIFIVICLIIPDKMSVLGYLAYLLCGLFSVGAVFIPLLMVIHALFWKSDAKNRKTKSKFIINAGIVVSVSTLWQLIGLGSDREGFHTYKLIGEGSLFAKGVSYTGGGLVGGLIGNALQAFMGVGAWIVCIFVIIILGFAMFNVTPVDMVAFIRNKLREWSYNAKLQRKEHLEQSIREQSEREKEQPQEGEEAAEQLPLKKRRKAYLGGIGDDGDEDGKDKPEKGEEDDSKKDLDISEEAVRRATGENAGAVSAADISLDGIFGGNAETGEGESFAPDKSTYDSIKSKFRFVSSGEKAEGDDEPKEIDLAEIFAEDAVIASAGVEANTSDVLAEGSRIEGAVSEIKTDNDFEGEKEDVAVSHKPDISETYKFPPIDFLTRDPNPATFMVTEELKETAVKLVETLANFGVKTKITNISCGPTVTRYELQPEVGVRVKSIQNLSDDIALHLAAAGVRIEAPIPGKDAVGIEVPNKTVSTVYLRNLIENPKFEQLKSKISVCLGMDVAGSPMYMDIAKMPHLLIAGATGMGKSVCINSFIVSLLYKARPDECKLILIDPKSVEFSVYNGMPHLLVPVVSDPKKAAGSLAWAVNEMERRFTLIGEVGVRDADTYNEITKNDPEREKLPKIVIIIDELADLMMTARDAVETSICRIAQKARAAGMHLIIGTQRPSVDVVTGLIKANVPSRICCTVASQVDSRTVIDVAGAEKLLGRGDMLYAPVGCMKPMRVQGAFVKESEIENIVSYLRGMGEAEYDDDVIRSIEREAERCGEKKGKKDMGGGESDDYDVDDRDAILDSDDAMFPAIEIAVDANMISTSLLQRKLSLGYSRAARIVDKLEKIGVIGPFEGSKPRKVLITRQEYLEMKMNHEQK